MTHEADSSLVTQGGEARALRDNPAFDRMMKNGRGGVLEAIAETKPEESEKREFLYKLVRCFDFLEPVLVAAINTGVHAARDAARAAAAKAAKES